MDLHPTVEGSSDTICLVRWSIIAPSTTAAEWHVTSYITSGYNSTTNPTNNATYYQVIDGVNCPQPLCNAVADISLVLDESGSISTAHAYPAVKNFALGVVNIFNGSYGPNGTMMGLSYFSGQWECANYSDPGTWRNPIRGLYCPSYCYGWFCPYCGGRWGEYYFSFCLKWFFLKLTNQNSKNKKKDVAVSPPTYNQTLLQTTIQNHKIQNGWTCLSCGVEQGTKNLISSPRYGTVPGILFFFTDGQNNRVYDYLAVESEWAQSLGIQIFAIGVGKFSFSPQTL